MGAGPGVTGWAAGVPILLGVGLGVAHDTGMKTRRDFLVSSVGLGIATGVGGRVFGPSSIHAAVERKGGALKIRICLKHGMIKEGKTVAEQMRAAKEAGFDGVEFEGPLAEEKVPEVLAAKAETGLAVPGMVCGKVGRLVGSLDAAEREKGIGQFSTTLRQAKQLGATTVLLYPGACDETKPYDKVFDVLIESVGKLLPMAKETGVAIALENVWNNMFLSPLDVIRFVDHFNTPLVGWYFDIGNICRYGWPDQWIRALGPRIRKLDVKEFNRKKSMEEGPWAGFKVDLGEGDIDWKAVCAAIDDVGYAGGWASAEVPGGDLARLKAICAWMHGVLGQRS